MKILLVTGFRIGNPNTYTDSPLLVLLSVPLFEALFATILPKTKDFEQSIYDKCKSKEEGGGGKIVKIPFFSTNFVKRKDSMSQDENYQR